MNNLKKNPAAWAALCGIGYLALICVVFFILSLIRKDRPFADTFRDPVRILVIVVGAVASVVQGYNKAKKLQSGEEKKE